MNFVDLDRVSLRYGEDADGTLALQGTSLSVGSGEFVAGRLTPSNTRDISLTYRDGGVT